MTSNKQLCKKQLTLDEARIRIVAYKNLNSCFDSIFPLINVMDYNEEIRDFMREYVKDLKNDLQAHRYCLLKQMNSI